MSNTKGCVTKNHLGYKNTERYFSSGGNTEEIGHESNLSANVDFPDSFNLSLPDHHKILTARAANSAMINRESSDCSIIRTFTHLVSTGASVGEKAVLVLKAKNK